ncbi:MFS transporter [Adlercreutzia sp. ZJ242]|uniref:MFS transporter n=1 Tax=Adlercreutzia sp. ZJ242 TaxID=2709409 RepID=UPI0013ECB4DF|nr:MFS transporter [Adlercreutzia sp. ZJ242]
MDNAKFKLTMPLVILLTVASGLAIGNLYWAQPLLVQIASDLGVTVADSGLLITATQIGYALGILLIVPLGDICPRRKLISTVMTLVAASLLACALSPSFILLAFSLSAMGITTVAGQIIIPMARDLADPEQQGQVVGTVTAGIMLGILVARSVSGLVADILGWRAIYGIAATLNLLLMAVLWKCLPKLPPKEKVAYGILVADVFKAVAQYRPLKWILIANGLVFGVVFSLFWNAVTFLLGGEPFNFNTFQIGLVSFAGITGAAGSVWVGRLQDRGIGMQAVGVFIALSFVSMLVALLASGSIVLIVIAAALYSLGVQGISTLNQLRTMSLDPAKSSRLNTAFVFSNFVFSAIGSAASGFIWTQAGWTGICATSLAVTAIAALSWFRSRKDD